MNKQSYGKKMYTFVVVKVSISRWIFVQQNSKYMPLPHRHP